MVIQTLDMDKLHKPVSGGPTLTLDFFQAMGCIWSSTYIFNIYDGIILQ